MTSQYEKKKEWSYTNEKYINKIIHGNAIELLKKIEDDSVDAVITDPPYCSGGQTAGERAKSPAEKYEHSSNKVVHRIDFAGDTMDQRSWVHWCSLWIAECQRILKPSGYFLMFTDWRQLPAASDTPKRQISLDRQADAADGRTCKSRAERWRDT